MDSILDETMLRIDIEDMSEDGYKCSASVKCTHFAENFDKACDALVAFRN